MSLKSVVLGAAMLCAVTAEAGAVVINEGESKIVSFDTGAFNPAYDGSAGANLQVFGSVVNNTSFEYSIAGFTIGGNAGVSPNLSLFKVFGPSPISFILSVIEGDIDFSSLVFIQNEQRAFGIVEGNASAVPVPAALPLLASGLGALGFAGWRRQKKNKLAA